MEIQLRLEEENDYKIVENLTREAFWNLYFPGCDEHFLVHNLRKSKEFVKKLDFVAIYNGKIVGNIVYAEAKIVNSDKNFTVLTFGPLCVSPEYQRKGIGKKLINHTAKLAKEMGYKAVIIYGYPEIYSKLGFKPSKEFNITNKEQKFPISLQILEFFDGALNEIEGIFDEGECYKNADEQELSNFEKEFPPKVKGFAESQKRFMEIITKFL